MTKIRTLISEAQGSRQTIRKAWRLNREGKIHRATLGKLNRAGERAGIMLWWEGEDDWDRNEVEVQLTPTDDDEEDLAKYVFDPARGLVRGSTRDTIGSGVGISGLPEVLPTPGDFVRAIKMLGKKAGTPGVSR